ncbi:hypothetical protein [Demequina sediminicola]|uniref:hypothetical protein n=1 Tax=Demequina sediminicola TaxID=1095026 RepID=UPI00128C07AA|nr:hypothetical protein [Demequina sediminicola]
MLKYIGAGRFVGIGLVGNIVIAIETIWLSSQLGVLGVALFWFLPTVVFLVRSTVRLTELFGHPSLLDEVVKLSLVGALSSRFEDVARSYAEATRQLDGLVASGWSHLDLGSATVTVRVPVPRVGAVIKAIRPDLVRQALDLLAPRANETRVTEPQQVGIYSAPRVLLDVEPGDRTRLGETAFRIIMSESLDEPTQDRVIQVLQASVDFEPSGAVTPDEETDREIANLKDAIGTNLRSGAFATAERALELLGAVVRGVWTAQADGLDSSRRSLRVREDWLFRSVGEVERDAVLSPRVAGIFVGLAMTRALEAPRTGPTEYVDECLRSFTRIWSDVLQVGGDEYEHIASRIVVCVQNLAAFSSPEPREDLASRATWAMVEMVKLALDAGSVSAAVLAAEELSGLFEYSDRLNIHRPQVRAGQLVLAGWLDYLADKKDKRDPSNAVLRELVSPRGTIDEILAARRLAQRGANPFSRWDWWEMKSGGTSRAQVLELSHYVDKAQLAALTSSRGTLPPARDQETASEYQRLVELFKDSGDGLGRNERELEGRLRDEIAKWQCSEDQRLASEPLSDARFDALRIALRQALEGGERITDKVPVTNAIPDHADSSTPILGMNLRVPRHYLVEKTFNRTYADPAELGTMIARGFMESEDAKIVQALRSIQGRLLEPSGRTIRESIDALGKEAAHYVLLTPCGGMEDSDGWYSSGFREVLRTVSHFETSVLSGEAILFDGRTTLNVCRAPEKKEGLVPVAGTSIAVGVFEDVQGGDEPQVRVEVGEYFVVWPGDASKVIRFTDN